MCASSLKIYFQVTTDFSLQAFICSSAGGGYKNLGGPAIKDHCLENLGNPLCFKSGKIWGGGHGSPGGPHGSFGPAVKMEKPLLGFPIFWVFLSMECTGTTFATPARGVKASHTIHNTHTYYCLV